MSSNITLSATDSHKIIELAAEMLVEEIRNDTRCTIDKEVKKRLDAMLQEAFSDDLRARIAKCIDAVLEEGWYRTDEYGTILEKSEKLSIRDFVLMFMKGKSYSVNRQHRMESILSENAEKFITKELTEYARPKLRAEIDKVIQAKFAESLRDALGLK